MFARVFFVLNFQKAISSKINLKNNFFGNTKKVFSVVFRYLFSETAENTANSPYETSCPPYSFFYLLSLISPCLPSIFLSYSFSLSEFGHSGGLDAYRKVSFSIMGTMASALGIFTSGTGFRVWV